MVQSQSRSLPQLLTPARARPAPSPTCDSSSAADIRAQRTLVTIAAAASGLGDRDGRSRRQGIEALGDYEYPFKLFYSGLQARGRDVAPPCRAADRSRGPRVRPRREPAAGRAVAGCGRGPGRQPDARPEGDTYQVLILFIIIIRGCEGDTCPPSQAARMDQNASTYIYRYVFE